MKKLFFITVLALSATLSARAQFFWGFQFGLYTDGSTTSVSNSDATVKGGSSFNYSLKPSIGYYFTPKFVGGLKLIYTSNSFAENDSGTSATTLTNYAINLLMGNGLDKDCMSWKVAPYLRYNALSLFQEKLRLWVELTGFVGAKYPWDKVNKCYLREKSETIYGVSLHPLVSFDIADKWMLFTNLDILSIGWEGSTKKQQYTTSSGEPYIKTTSTNTFLFQSNPTVALARIFTNIGVIKKF